MDELRKTAAKYSKHIFLSEEDELVFFVEDTNITSKKLYSEILGTIFKNITINNIFPLGSRIEVVNQCSKVINDETSRKEIYLVDGDLYLLSGEDETIFPNIDKLEKLFVLPRYCIENYLLSEESIIDILDDEDLVKQKDDIKIELDYLSWINNNNELFKRLYIEYAIAKKEVRRLQTIGYDISSLVSGNSGVLDEVKVENRIKSIKAEVISEIGVIKYENTKSVVSNNIKIHDEFMLHYVSAKDHLLPLLFPKLHCITKLKCYKNTYMIKLAKRINSNNLKEIVDFVIELYPSAVNSIA